MKLTLALFAFFLGGSVYAADTCGPGAPNPDEIEACASRLAEKAETALSQVYGLARDSLTANETTDLQGDLASLQQTQNAWLAYREAQCDFEYEQARSGTLRNAAQLFCMQRLTEARTKELSGYVPHK
jgi:uncharacterized protein YecT (DUF1311 family)